MLLAELSNYNKIFLILNNLHFRMNQGNFFIQSKDSHSSSPPFFPIAQSCPQFKMLQTQTHEEGTNYINMEQFKVFPCHLKKQHNHKQCFFYHSSKDQRRSNKNYNEEICFFILNNQECQLGEDCPFSHNQVEERYMPRNYKKKFCYFFEIGKVENCEYGQCCSYAHCDSEINIELLHKMKEDEHFFIYKFKTVMCPFFNLKHDKGTCVYAHNFQDFRRRPDVFSYDMKPCPFWKYDAYVHSYEEGCPNGEKCDKCHGWKELDFHPLFYKTTPCPNSVRCYKNFLCPYYHHENDQRYPFFKFKSFLF